MSTRSRAWGASLITTAIACGANAVAPRQTEPAPLNFPLHIVDAGATPLAASLHLEVAVGVDRVCVRQDQSVYCAHGAPASLPLSKTKSLFDHATGLALGGFGFVCTPTTDGEVQCSGTNERGDLGAGLRAGASADPVTVIGIKDATSVVAGNHHACALSRDGSVRCWGNNEYGQTGSSTSYEGETRELVKPSRVPEITAIKLAAADDATCAITKTREVVCWGELSIVDHAGGQRTGNFRPTPIEGLTDVDEISGGGETFCAVRGGEVWCWGVLEKIMQPPPTMTGMFHVSFEGVHVEGLRNIAHIGLANDYACAVARDGYVWCWGQNNHDVLGRTNKSTDLMRPAIVDGLPRSVAIAVGYGMTCSVDVTDAVHCWGEWPSPYDDKDPNGLRKSVAHEPTPLIIGR